MVPSSLSKRLDDGGKAFQRSRSVSNQGEREERIISDGVRNPHEQFESLFEFGSRSIGAYPTEFPRFVKDRVVKNVDEWLFSQENLLTRFTRSIN